MTQDVPISSTQILQLTCQIQKYFQLLCQGISISTSLILRKALQNLQARLENSTAKSKLSAYWLYFRPDIQTSGDYYVHRLQWKYFTLFYFSPYILRMSVPFRELVG